MPTTRARQLRANPTDAEKALWRHLRQRQLNGVRFRRQQPLGAYVVDFISFDAMLVVEVDGGQHATADESARDAFIRGEGFQVLRFWNNDVLSNIEGVLMTIAAAAQPSPGAVPD
jgi:very-short-patch-repair endonuclease